MKNILLKSVLLIGLISLLTIQEKAEAQNWVPLANNQGMTVKAMSTFGDSVVAVFLKNYTLTSDTLVVAIWNGSFWSNLPPLIGQIANVGIFDSLNLLSIITYNNEIYLGGEFDSIVGIPNSRDIVRWNGSQWTDVGGGVDSINSNGLPGISGFSVFNGELYAIGSFTKIGGSSYNKIASWNGTSWNSVGNFSTSSVNSNTLECITTIGSNLYVGGQFDTISGVIYNSIAQWNGTSWSALGNGFTGYYDNVYALGEYSGKLFASGYISESGSTLLNNIASWNGTSWDDASGGHTSSYIYSFAQNSGLLWAGGYVYYNTGYSDLSTWNGTKWDSVPTAQGYTTDLISNNMGLYGIYNGVPSTWCNAGNCGVVSGNVYDDINGNCALDGSDTVLSESIITLDGSTYATTDASGNYTIYSPPGTHALINTPYKYWSVTCPSSGYSLSVAAGTTYTGYNFADQPQPGIIDLGVSIGSMFGWVARIDSTDDYSIDYKNYGTVATSSSVVLQLDSHLLYISATPAPTTISGNTITWNFTSLGVLQTGSIVVSVFVPDTLVLHSFVHNVVKILPTTGDADTTNNIDSLVTIVGNAWDPNGKQVNPAGAGVDGNITGKDSVLTYAVDFQNTGNAYAVNVVVIDTIDPTVVDPLTLQFGAHSNNYTYTLTGKGILTFYFNNINLPPKTVNEKKSTGFLQYSIHLRNGLTVGSQIKNSASIYFDFNQPVKTNTALNTLTSPTGIAPITVTKSYTVFPNPADNLVQISNPLQKNVTCEVVNILGQTIRSYSANNQKLIAINTNQLEPGIYLVRLKDDSATTIYKVEVQH